MNMSMDFARKVSLAYSAACKPLCHELGLPQTAFDILMFLANNPDYNTASDIVEVRKIKANLVSVNVDKLVRKGYLERETLRGDRRKTQLTCTEQAAPIIEKGRRLQTSFGERLMTDIDAQTRQAFWEAIRRIGKNLDTILEGEN